MAMRRLRKILLLLLPFVVIILIGVMVLGRLGPPPEQIRLIAQSELSRLFGRPVTIGAVSRGLLGQAVLRDVRIGPPPQAQGELFRAPAVTVHYRLRDLLAGRTDAIGSIGLIVVDRPTLVVERAANGVWSVTDLFKRPRPAKPVRFQARVVLRRGQVTVIDRAAPRGVTTYELKPFYADVDWGRPRQVAIALSGESGNSRFRRVRAALNYDGAHRTFEVSLNASRVAAATVDRYLPRLAPVGLASGAVDAQVLAAIPLRGKTEWSASLALDRVGARVAFVGQRIVVSGRLRVANDVLRLDDVRAESEAARLHITGAAANLANPQLDLNVEATSDRPLLLVPADRRAAVAKWVTPGGPLTAQVHIVGPASRPAVAGHVALASITTSGIRAEQPSADLTYRPSLALGMSLPAADGAILSEAKGREGQVWLDHVQARVAGGRVTGKAWVALGKKGADAVIRADLVGVRAEEIARALKAEPVIGGVSGAVAVNVSQGRPDVIARLTVGAGSARGVPFDGAQFLARYTNGAVTLSEAEVTSPYGRLRASGSASRRALDLNVSAGDVDLAAAGSLLDRALRVPRASPLRRIARELAGVASAQGRISGPPASPKFEGTVAGSDLRVAGYQADALEAHLSASQRQIQISTATVYRGGGRITASGDIIGPDFARAEVRGRLQVRSADLAEFLPPQDRQPRFAGLLNATFDIAGRLPGPSASGTVEVEGLEVNAISLGAARADIAYREGLVTLKQGGLTMNGSRVSAQGTIATQPAPGEVNLTVSAENLDLSKVSIERLQRAGVKLAGRVNLEAQVTGNPRNPTASGTVRDSQVSLNGMRLRNLAGAGSWSAGRADVQGLEFNLGKGAFSLSGSANTQDGALDLQFHVRDGDLAALRSAAPALVALGGDVGGAAGGLAKVPAPFSGTLTAHGQITGKPAQRSGDVTFEAGDVVIGGTPVPSLNGKVKFAGSVLTVERFVAQAEEAYATAKGTVDLAGEMRLDVDAYNISAQTIRSVTGVKQPLSGTANVSMLVTGPTHSPHVVATATASDARIGPVALGDVLVSKVEISDSAIAVDKVTLAPGGRQMWASGTAAFSWATPHRPPDGALDITINLGQQDLGSVALLLPDLVTKAQGPISGGVRVRGTWAHPLYDGQAQAKGKIAIGKFAETDLDASLRLTTQEGSARPVVTGRVAVRPVMHGVPPLKFALALRPKQLPTALNPRLDLKVVVEDDTHLETASAGMWLTGKGNIGGTLAAATVSINMESRNGFLQFPGSRLRLIYASVDLSRPVPTAEQPTPRLRLPLNADYEGEATRYELTGAARTYTITMRLSGDLLDPERPLAVAMNSVPDLPERDIFAMVMGFGGLIGGLQGQSASALLGSQARDLFTTGVVPLQLHPLEVQIAKALGVEEFALGFSPLGASQTVQLRLGKALSKRLYASYSRALARGQRDQLSLTLELAPTLSLGWTYESGLPGALPAAATLSEQRPVTRVELRKTWRF